MVIVIFAVGILAVVQIFPRGFQVLMRARENSVATNLARAEIERLKSRPDQLPSQIVARIRLGNGAVIFDPNRSPDNLGPVSQTLGVDGHLINNGNDIGSWQINSGPNLFRGIIGEGGQVPATSWVGGLYGRLRVLQFGPLSVQPDGTPDGPLLVYGNDLTRRGYADLFDPSGNFNDKYERTGYEYYVQPPDNSGGWRLYLPSGQYDRAYRIAFTGYVGANKTVNVVTTATVPAGTQSLYGNYPLSSPFSLNGSYTGLTGIELDSIRVAQLFKRVDPTVQEFADNPYSYALLDPSFGVLLFSPAEPEDRTPLVAKVDYDVLDWRIIRDEFRVADGPNPQHRLALGNLKVGGSSGPDGLTIKPIWFDFTNTNIEKISDPKADNFVVQDLITGGIVAEKSMNSDKRLISIDKSLGVVTFYDADTSRDGIQGELLTPGASGTQSIDLANRPLRALYMANGEWSVQVLKGATFYSVAYARPGPGEYYVGGSGPLGGLANRVYFSPSDVGRRVSFDVLWVIDAAGRTQQLSGQTFQIRFSRSPDPLQAQGLPMIDIQDVIPGGSFYSGNGYVARGVKGASIAVRVLHNPASFSLTNTPATNIQRLEQWGRNWNRRTVETFIQRGDEAR